MNHTCYLVLMFFISLPLYSMERLSDESSSSAQLSISEESHEQAGKIAQKLIGFLSLRSRGNTRANFLLEAIIDKNNIDLYELIKNGASLKDETSTQLIKSYDSHQYYPRSFKKLLSVMPKQVLTDYLAQANVGLIPLLAKCGADVIAARQYISDTMCSNNSTPPAQFKARLTQLELASPDVSLCRKHYIYCRSSPELYCCACVAILGTIAGVTLILALTLQ